MNPSWPRKHILKIQLEPKICPPEPPRSNTGPPRSNTGPPNPPRLLPVPRRAPRAEVGKEPPGNQVYFVQRPFCASNTRLLGKSAKRMKHELSFFFNTNPTSAPFFTHHTGRSAPHGLATCAPCCGEPGLELLSNKISNCNNHLKAEMASFISS